jgi:DNA-binding GntR family transcriptional regulator
VGTLVTTLDLRYLKQVYALRMRLIDLTGEHPVPALAEADRLRLVALHERAVALRDVSAEPIALAEVYHEFHETLLRLVGNRPLREISDRYFVQTSRMWLQLLPEMDWEVEVAAVIDELEGVTEALTERDTRRVTDVRRRHFRAVLQRMNAVLAGDDLDVLPREGVIRP